MTSPTLAAALRFTKYFMNGLEQAPRLQIPRALSVNLFHLCFSPLLCALGKWQPGPFRAFAADRPVRTANDFIATAAMSTRRSTDCHLRCDIDHPPSVNE